MMISDFKEIKKKELMRYVKAVDIWLGSDGFFSGLLI